VNRDLDDAFLGASVDEIAEVLREMLPADEQRELARLLLGEAARPNPPPEPEPPIHLITDPPYTDQGPRRCLTCGALDPIAGQQCWRRG
jgi:hypothetical protein